MVVMNRVSDNYFTAFANSGQAFNFPTTLQVTSVLGDTVFDTVATSAPSVRNQCTDSTRKKLTNRK